MVILNADDHYQPSSGIRFDLEYETKLIIESHGTLVCSLAFQLFVMQRFEGIEIPFVHCATDKLHSPAKCFHHVRTESAAERKLELDSLQFRVGMTDQHFHPAGDTNYITLWVIMKSLSFLISKTNRSYRR